MPEPVALGGAPWAGRDAAEAHRVTFGVLGDGHRPVLPELPDRGPGADPVGRSAALLSELTVDLQPHGWRVSPPSSSAAGMDRRRARSYWREDAQRWADTAGAEGAPVDRLAVRVLGPLTLLGSLWLPGGERVLVDAGARRDVAASYREGLGDALAELRGTTGAARLDVVLDEPLAAAVLGGTLPTASGYRTVRSLPRDEARALWRDQLAALAVAGIGETWVDPHAAEPAVRDLAVLAGECLPATRDDDDPSVGLVLDVGALEQTAGQEPRPASGAASSAVTPAAWDVVAGWADAGRRVALRTAPVPEARLEGLLRTWDRLGLDPALLRDLTLTVPGPHDAATLARLRDSAEELDARVGELLG